MSDSVQPDKSIPLSRLREKTDHNGGIRPDAGNLTMSGAHSGAESAPGFNELRESLAAYEGKLPYSGLSETSNHNIAIGEHNPDAIHTGKNGVCIGYRPEEATTGSHSIAVGRSALYNSGSDHSLNFSHHGEEKTCVSFHPPGHFPGLPIYSISIHSGKRMGAVVMLPSGHPLCRKVLDLAMTDVSDHDGIVVLNLENYNPEQHGFPQGIEIHGKGSPSEG